MTLTDKYMFIICCHTSKIEEPRLCLLFSYVLCLDICFHTNIVEVIVILFILSKFQSLFSVTMGSKPKNHAWHSTKTMIEFHATKSSSRISSNNWCAISMHETVPNIIWWGSCENHFCIIFCILEVDQMLWGFPLFISI